MSPALGSCWGGSRSTFPHGLRTIRPSRRNIGRPFGIFPAVGGSRPAGTTCLIEDVAFHIEDLPRATAELQALIARHGYDDACIYGHALEGNYHFIINQSFSTPAEVARYEALMNDVAELVVGRYDGSLKAEHGTGRNMAPFLRREWGDDALAVMRAVKELFDPAGLLNPGVIFNDDPRCHLSHFKPLPLTDPLIDRCIECGFCEVNCLTCGLTLSSRQRIVVRREIARLKASGENPRLVRELEHGYRYPGERTCAGDGLCSTSCPVGINAGELTHALRALRVPPGSAGHAAGEFAARRFAGLKNTLRPVLTLADTAHRVLGTRTMTAAAKGLHALGLPQWLPSMPRAYRLPETLRTASAPEPDKVVYFPSCINQTMGLARETPVAEPLAEKMVGAAPQGGLRGGLSREHGTSLLRHDLGEQGHGRHRRPQDRRAGRGALARQRGGTLAGAVRPEPLPAPHAREDRPHETLRTCGIHLDLPARPAGVPAPAGTRRRACHLLDAPHGAGRSDRRAGAAVRR